MNKLNNQYEGQHEKRKYFIIKNDLTVVKKKPSYILELLYVYNNCDNIKDDVRKRIEVALSNEKTEIFKDKIKKIDRLSKMTLTELDDRFWRSIINQDKIHSIKLGNELFIRNKELFLSHMYKYALISDDENKLIKIHLFDRIIEKLNNDNEIYIRNLLQNIINYFIKSNNNIIIYKSNNHIEYMEKKEVNKLYKLIYANNYDNIIYKYNIENVHKLKFESEDLEMNESENILYEMINEKII